MGYILPEYYEGLAKQANIEFPKILIETGTFKGGLAYRYLGNYGSIEPFHKIYTFELGEKIANLVPDTTVTYVDISFQDARNYMVDNSKSLETFKYKPSVTVEEEVNRMIKLFTENRIENPEDKVYHNGAFIKNKKEQNQFV